MTSGNPFIPDELAEIFLRTSEWTELTKDPKFVPTQAETDRHTLATEYTKLKVALVGASQSWGQIAEENRLLKEKYEGGGNENNNDTMPEVPREEVPTG